MQSKFTIDQQRKFPEVRGMNLEREKYLLPYDLQGEINIVVIAFKQHQQLHVDQWFDSLAPELAKYPTLRFFELPTLSRKYLPLRFLIDGGMRSGIPDIKIRKRTITLYINKNQIKDPLGITDESQIYLFLINNKGDIFWHSNGIITEQKHKGLMKSIQENLGYSYQA